MEITTILNRKASAAIAADPQFQRQLAQAVQLGSRTPSEMSAEQAASQAGDHSVLSYPSNPSPLHPMTNMPPHGVPHPNNGIPMMPNAYMHGGYPSNPHQMPAAPQVPQGRSGAEPAPRIFHCSTCNKGFARRSDLARHGKRRILSFCQAFH
jgi:hypothetical protein